MATIPDLVNPLEGTAPNAVTVTGNIDGVFGAAPTYSSTAVQGSTSVQFSQINNNSNISFDLTSSRALIYYDFYLQMVTVPNDSFPLINWTTAAGAIKGGDIRIVGNGTTFNFQVRKSASNTVVNTTTWNLPVGQYRVQVKLDPDSATGYRVQVWSGSPLTGTIPNYDTGNLDATGSGITATQRVNIGIIAATTTQATFRVDDILADDADPIVRTSQGSTGAYYKKNGQWITYEHFYRKNGSWSSSTPLTRPDPVTTTSVTSGSITQTSVGLTWTPPAGGSAADKYGVFRGQQLVKDSIGPTETSTTVTGLTAATSYTLDVRRYNSVGWSDPGPTVTFDTLSASTFIFNPAIGVSDGNNYHGGATAQNNDWDAWRSYNYSNAKSKANLPGTSKPRIIGVTGNNTPTASQGSIWKNETDAYNYWVGNLEDFYYGTGSAERKNVELHIGNGNEYGDKVADTQAALDEWVAGCRGIYRATRRENSDGTRRYPLASSWIDPTHEQENSRDSLNGGNSWSVAITAAAAAPYIDGIAWSMYPPGRKYEISGVPQVGNPRYNWPSFVEADRWTGDYGWLYRCFKRTEEAAESAGKTLKIAVWEFGIGDDPNDTTTRPYYATHLIGSMGRLAQQFGIEMTEIIWWDQQKNETSQDVGPHPQNILSAGPGVQIRRSVNGTWITSTILPNDAANASIGSGGGYAEGALGERTTTNPSTTQALKNWRSYNNYYGGTPPASWAGNPKSGWIDTNLSAWQSSMNAWAISPGPPPAA